MSRWAAMHSSLRRSCLQHSGFFVHRGDKGHTNCLRMCNRAHVMQLCGERLGGGHWPFRPESWLCCSLRWCMGCIQPLVRGLGCFSAPVSSLHQFTSRWSERNGFHSHVHYQWSQMFIICPVLPLRVIFISIWKPQLMYTKHFSCPPSFISCPITVPLFLPLPPPLHPTHSRSHPTLRTFPLPLSSSQLLLSPPCAPPLPPHSYLQCSMHCELQLLDGGLACRRKHFSAFCTLSTYWSNKRRTWWRRRRQQLLFHDSVSSRLIVA